MGEMSRRDKFLVICLCFCSVILDQYVKLWVHFNMKLGELRDMGLVHFYYVTNPGICMGHVFEWEHWKLILLLLRFALIYYVVKKVFYDSTQYLYRRLRMYGAGLILGGAIGNCIDIIFYGVLLGNAPSYAPMKLFNGQVIDMLCFSTEPINILPEWFPIFGGVHHLPIFNVADLCIIFGAIFFVFFDKKLNDK